MRGPTGEGQPHREECGLGLDPTQDHPQIMEVHLGHGRRWMGLRHVAHFGRLAVLGGDLRSAFAHVVAHRRVGQIRCVVLVHQPRQDPPRGMTLLLRRIQVTAQPVIDRGLERLQPPRHPGRRLARRRDRARQRLPHRAPVHVISVSQLADRALLDPRVAPDRGEQLHPRPHHLQAPSVIGHDLSWLESRCHRPKSNTWNRQQPEHIAGGHDTRRP